jgi:two-component system response regulator AtoC
MKILVVDDDPDILRLCATALRAQGHSVVTCDSGGPALQAALREEFDLALCDLNLPDIHGLEVVRAIKMQAPALSVIVMSALDPAEWTKPSTEAGAAFFLAKPLRLDTLRHEVNMVERSRAGLELVMVGDDRHERRLVTEHFRSAGCVVHHGNDVADALVLLADHAPDLVIVDGDQRDAHVLITVCGRKNVACFVLAGPLFDDDAALREGASLVMQKPAIPDALLLQARFLAGR